MRTETFQSIRREIARDPLTERQAAESGDPTAPSSSRLTGRVEAKRMAEKWEKAGDWLSAKSKELLEPYKIISKGASNHEGLQSI